MRIYWDVHCFGKESVAAVGVKIEEGVKQVLLTPSLLYEFCFFCFSIRLSVVVPAQFCFQGRFDKRYEYGLRSFNRAFEFRMELYAYKERMGRKLNDLYESGLGVSSA